MSYNTIGYLIFFFIMFYVIGVVGWQFYKHGKHYLEDIFQDELHLVESVNKLLLLGYYLFNLGYVALSINGWRFIDSSSNLIAVLASNTGEIILLLGVMHYLNLFWLSRFQQIKSIFQPNI